MDFLLRKMKERKLVYVLTTDGMYLRYEPSIRKLLNFSTSY